MFKRFMRFVPIIALFLFALLMINQPRTADASPKGDITFNYAPEHMSLSRARDGQFLSGPAAGDAYKIAVDYLNAQKAALALNGADLTFVVTDRYTSETNGVTHIYLQQQVNGLVVQGAVININVTADGRILNVGSSFIGNAAQQANSNIPGLDANDAVTAAANYLSSPLTAPLTVVRQWWPQSDHRVQHRGNLPQQHSCPSGLPTRFPQRSPVGLGYRHLPLRCPKLVEPAGRCQQWPGIGSGQLGRSGALGRNWNRHF